jgi:hypothetical protein
MPSVMDAPELVDYVETHDLAIETIERRERERPRPRRARPGFWRTLVQRIMPSLTPARRERHALSLETSMERFVQEYPSLSIYAFSRI